MATDDIERANLVKFGDWYFNLYENKIININHDCKRTLPGGRPRDTKGFVKGFVVRRPEWGPSGPPQKIYIYKYCSRCRVDVPDKINMMVKVMALIT